MTTNQQAFITELIVYCEEYILLVTSYTPAKSKHSPTINCVSSLKTRLGGTPPYKQAADKPVSSVNQEEKEPPRTKDLPNTVMLPR